MNSYYGKYDRNSYTIQNTQAKIIFIDLLGAMKLCIDANNLLCADNSAEQWKLYTQNIQGYNTQDYDKPIFVEHKRMPKIHPFKELGDTMSVFYVTNRKTTPRASPIQINHNGILSALMLYKWYDESTNKNYSFLYKYPINNVNVLNTQLHLLGIAARVDVTEKWLIVSSDTTAHVAENTTDIDAIVNYLFMLTLLYGKMDIRDTALMSIKIHIPLFWAYLKEQKVFDTLLYFLQTKGMFLQKSIVQSNDGIIYQINTSDYELLGAFAQLYKGIAKIDKIPTFDRLLQSKESLVTYINQLVADGQLENDIDVLRMIEGNVIKTLQK